MGDILFLVHRLPYPPDRGDRIRSWHVLKALAKLGPVHVCALLDDEHDRQHVAMVESVAASVTVAQRDSARANAMLRAVMSGRPASVEAFWSAQLNAAVAARLASGAVDTIYAFSSQMAAYVPPGIGGRFVMDFVDMDSAKFAAIKAWGLLGVAMRREAARLKAWEITTAKRATVSLFVSHAEADLFTRETSVVAEVLENGIDLDRYRADAVVDLPAHPARIVFTGQMDYAPNIEAVIGFVRESLPRIRTAVPDVSFAIVGRAPTAAVRALASNDVIVTGAVADTRGWLASADIVVAPLKLARGVQNKVLEAMAMGKAVVASSGAAEGLDAVDGRDLIVADDPAEAVIALLGDPARRAALGAAARTQMESRYGWDAQMVPLAGFVGR